jgi:hypothetical protein
LRYALLRVHAIEPFGSFSHDGKLTQGVLIHCTNMKQEELDPSMADLEKEGMIRRTSLCSMRTVPCCFMLQLWTHLWKR